VQYLTIAFDGAFSTMDHIRAFLNLNIGRNTYSIYPLGEKNITEKEKSE
jgi:hypothetical protein